MFFEINEENEIKVFEDGSEIAFLIQPHFPNGDSFDSFDEASDWANLFIASFVEGALLAPEGKGLTGKPKPPMQPTKEGKVYIWDNENLSWTEKSAS